jgi:hypothetical protein
LTLILVHTAHPQALGHAGPGFGRLLSPRDCSRAADTGRAGIPWAADNDAFLAWDARRYRLMLAAIQGAPGCLFVTAPDVVGEAVDTWVRFHRWRDVLHGTGQPIAYVLQDGATSATVPWDEIGAVFVGGTTKWKLSGEAEHLVREAARRGLWVHMGRVNSRRRYDYARALGCDSVDGSQFSRWRKTWLPAALAWHREPFQERLQL